MQNTTRDLTSTHTPFFVEGIEWDLTMDDPDEEYEDDGDDLPDNVIVNKITDDYGWCIDDIESWREIDPSEVEALLAA